MVTLCAHVRFAFPERALAQQHAAQQGQDVDKEPDIEPHNILPLTLDISEFWFGLGLIHV